MLYSADSVNARDWVGFDWRKQKRMQEAAEAKGARAGPFPEHRFTAVFNVPLDHLVRSWGQKFPSMIIFHRNALT